MCKRTLLRSTEASISRVKEYHTITTNKPRGTIRPPTKCGFEDMVSYTFVINSGDPNTFQEAVNSQAKSR